MFLDHVIVKDACACGAGMESQLDQGMFFHKTDCLKTELSIIQLFHRLSLAFILH